MSYLNGTHTICIVLFVWSQYRTLIKYIMHHLLAGAKCRVQSLAILYTPTQVGESLFGNKWSSTQKQPAHQREYFTYYVVWSASVDFSESRCSTSHSSALCDSISNGVHNRCALWGTRGVQRATGTIHTRQKYYNHSASDGRVHISNLGARRKGGEDTYVPY